jgi:hypothetical protein
MSEHPRTRELLSAVEELLDKAEAEPDFARAVILRLAR